MNIGIPSLDFTAIAPQAIAFVTALVVLVVDLVSPPGRRGYLAYLSLLGVIISGVVCFAIWDETAPAFQNMAVADGYTLFLNLVFLTAAGLSLLLSVRYIAREGMDHGEYYALLLFATTGMMLMGAATDLMVIFLGLEILSIPLYVLAGFNRDQLESGESALKYFLLGAFASGFLLYGMALTYGATGTTNLAGIAAFLSGARASPYGDLMLFIGLGLLIVGFGFKIALVPFHMWAPDVYQGAPTSVTAFMSVGAKAAGFAALARVFLYALATQVGDWSAILTALAIITMTFGNVVAIAQTNLKRLLAYSSIAHAGYILIAVIAANAAGLAALLFYLLVYAFMNIGAFAVVVAVGRRGEPREGLEDYAGLASYQPFLAAAMAIFMLSLAGVPPLAGFLGKLYVFSAAVEAGLPGLAIIGVINSVVSAYFYLRVIVYMYMRAPTGEPKPVTIPLSLAMVTALAVLGTVILGLWPSPLLDLAQKSVMAALGS